MSNHDEFDGDFHGAIRRIDKRVNDMYPIVITEIPKMQALIQSITFAHNQMSAAAERMALTDEKREERFNKLEERLQETNDRAAGKNQMPIWSHYLVLGGTVLITVLIILFVTQQTIDATLTSMKINSVESK